MVESNLQQEKISLDLYGREVEDLTHRVWDRVRKEGYRAKDILPIFKVEGIDMKRLDLGIISLAGQRCELGQHFIWIQGPPSFYESAFVSIKDRVGSLGHPNGKLINSGIPFFGRYVNFKNYSTGSWVDGEIVRIPVAYYDFLSDISLVDSRPSHPQSESCQ